MKLCMIDLSIINEDFLNGIIVLILVFLGVFLLEYSIKRAFRIDNDEKATELSLAQISLETLKNIVDEAVKYVNLTFVNDLKKEGKFNKEEKEEAFMQAKIAVENMVSNSLKQSISVIVNDFDTLIDTIIESKVDENKKK